ncbi:ABC transporter substrate-binding protein [Methanocella sp. MCL-LM]|uniref:ABC transporter substrate-binding protein n=1 Tax=Methanocella sp. MCL-LM TaxID=3412035 RepID=UPI003C724EB0
MLLSGCTQPASPTPVPANNTTSTSVTVTDTNGNVITLPAAADKIVVTNSDAAEVLIAIGAKDKIVGVASIVKKNPTVGPLVADVADVGDWQNPNMEQIAQLQPDVIITYASSKPKNADQLALINVSIVQLDCGNLNTLARDIRTMGTLTGNSQQAEDFAGFVDQNVGLVKNRTANVTEEEKPKVYWENNKAFTTAGYLSGGDVLITTAGGRNLAHDMSNASGGYVYMSAENILPNNPDVIIKYNGYTVGGNTVQNFTAIRGEIMNRTGIVGVKAVNNSQVYVLSSTITYGAKSPIGLLYVAKILYPETFADIDPAVKLDEYAERFVPGTNQTLVIYPTP